MAECIIGRGHQLAGRQPARNREYAPRRAATNRSKKLVHRHSYPRFPGSHPPTPPPPPPPIYKRKKKTAAAHSDPVSLWGACPQAPFKCRRMLWVDLLTAPPLAARESRRGLESSLGAASSLDRALRFFSQSRGAPAQLVHHDYP